MLRCTRCGAEGEGDKVDIYSRNSFTHKRGCGSGIGPLKVSGSKTVTEPVIQSTTSTEQETVVVSTKPKKKRFKKKSHDTKDDT